MSIAQLKVSVAYVDDQTQFFEELVLELGATAEQAVAQSGLANAVPDLSVQEIGIFGAVVPPTTQLKHGDRVEVYLPLRVEPMEARRRRASS